MVACKKDRPSLVTGGVTDAMRGVSASAVLTVPALAAVEIPWTGSPEPAGKYLASTFWAVTEAGVPRNDWAVVSVPILKPIRPAEPAASRMAVTTHTPRGLRLMAWPTRDHIPRLVGSGVPYLGLTGQKIHRPKTTSSAGSRVIIAIRPTATPMAATGPRPEMSLDSAAGKQSSPVTTVSPLALMAGPARCRAIAMSWGRTERLRSSSPYLATKSSA